MSDQQAAWLPSAAQLRDAFDAATPFHVGLEDELMLLHPRSLALAPEAPAALERMRGDPRFKLELPASQLEIVTAPVATVGEAAAALLAARRTLAERLDGLVLPAAAAVHPFSPGSGQLNAGGRYDRTAAEYGTVAARELVCAFQVHVSVTGADRALAVYNAARSYLPALAALAANGPFYEGFDTGLASVRPLISGLLPRQGVPPPLASWEEYAEALRWGWDSGAFTSPGTWWWELRPHPRFGTLEFRVPDAQSSVGDAAAVAAVIQCLVAWLAERVDGGERLPVAASWRIAENRWSACRWGVTGRMASLEGGAAEPTRAALERLLEALAPVARRLGCTGELGRAGGLLEGGGAARQRAAAADGGPVGVARYLAECFCATLAG